MRKMRVPTYRYHKPSGQAVVTFDGLDVYLGRYDTTASRRAYDRRVAEWLAAGRTAVLTPQTVTVADVCAGFLVARVCPDSQESEYRAAISAMLYLYGETPAANFGPLALQAVRSHVEAAGGIKRSTLNSRIHNIRRIFKWAVSMEMVPASVVASLEAVESLRAGDTTLGESKSVQPVPDAVVAATCEKLSQTVRDMVCVQALTGMRSEELCTMLPMDVDRSDSIWIYAIKDHKTAHHDIIRAVAIGPKAQAILLPYMDRRATDQPVFSPSEAVREMRVNRSATRKTPLNQGNRVGTNRAEKVERPVTVGYTAATYRNAIYRACDQLHPPPAEVARHRGEDEQQWKKRLGTKWAIVQDWRRRHRWHPHQLRHTFGTLAREQFGLDHAQQVLGHTNAKTTEIYAKISIGKAKEVVAKLG